MILYNDLCRPSLLSLLCAALCACDLPAEDERLDAASSAASTMADEGSSADDGDDGDGDDEPASLPLADVLNPALWNPFDVAVLASNSSCPNNSTYFNIFFDSEDDSNANATSGWRGDSWANGHYVRLWFCSVDGSQLKPLATSSVIANHYMVLKLGSNCPNNSVTVKRFVDTQNVDDQSSVGDGDGPNEKSGTGVWLHFCMFRGGPATMASFPTFEPGFQYGVFARNFARTLVGGAGHIFSDDENDANQNKYDAPGYIGDASRIIVGGANTTYHMARVR